MGTLTSLANPRVRRWMKLVRDARARRAEQRVIVEGPHLVEALLHAGLRAHCLLATEHALQRAEIRVLVRRAGLTPVILPERVFAAVVDAETPPGIAAEIPLPQRVPALRDSAACVFLDRIQDAGNVGAILRSAAAFGIPDVVLGSGCADPWSPKVLRAAMGAHFRLRLGEPENLGDALERFGGSVLCTAPRGGTPLHEADLHGRVGWLFGGEGQGVSASVAERASLRVTIPMAEGSESLNVAAAAAVCFYEAWRRR